MRGDFAHPRRPRDSSRSRAAVVGGLLDSGFAALAAFVSSVYASRVFETDVLGYYSVFLTAFVASSNVPGRLLFFPYEIASVAQPADRRLAFVQRGLIRAAPLSLASAAVASLIAAGIGRGAGASVLFPLGTSMVLAATLSPLQDHVRRMLHVDHRSRKAATVSALQLAGVLLFIVSMHLMRINPLWIPYMALAGANAVSLTLGVFYVRATRTTSERPPPFKSVARSAWWLLYLSLPGPAIGLVVNAFVLHLADATTLGFAEAARQVARPLNVINTGLGQSMRPRSFAAAQQRRRGAARRVERLVIATGVGLGAVYTALVAFESPLNLMAGLVPKAYEIGGLVVAVCISNIALGIAFPSGYELVGAGYERAASGIESVAQVARLAVAALAGSLGAFTIAATDTVLGTSRFIGNRLAVRRIYRDVVGGRRAAVGSRREPVAEYLPEGGPPAPHRPKHLRQ